MASSIVTPPSGVTAATPSVGDAVTTPKFTEPRVDTDCPTCVNSSLWNMTEATLVPSPSRMKHPRSAVPMAIVRVTAPSAADVPFPGSGGSVRVTQ
jgi:hypothetical protein